jgi:hypothetical protein
MLVCENHPDKAWPDECDCVAGMAAEHCQYRDNMCPCGHASPFDCGLLFSDERVGELMNDIRLRMNATNG